MAFNGSFSSPPGPADFARKNEGADEPEVAEAAVDGLLFTSSLSFFDTPPEVDNDDDDTDSKLLFLMSICSPAFAAFVVALDGGVAEDKIDVLFVVVVVVGFVVVVVVVCLSGDVVDLLFSVVGDLISTSLGGVMPVTSVSGSSFF